MGGGGGGGARQAGNPVVLTKPGGQVFPSPFSISFSVLKREGGRRRVLNSFSSLKWKGREGFILPNSFSLLKRRGGFRSPKLLLLIKKEGRVSFSQTPSPYYKEGEGRGCFILPNSFSPFKMAGKGVGSFSHLLLSIILPSPPTY